jgi:phosphate transport system protein
MTRTELDQKVHFARDQILLLGSMVEDAMYRSVRALKDHDLDASQAILENDQAINRKRFEIETAVISSIAMQQPIARDLRLFASVLDLCTELERIGDYAKGIAVINLRSGGLSLPKILNDIYYMSEKTLDMFHRALTAFIQEDVVAAKSIAREDDVIDAMYMQVYVEVIDLVVEHPNNMQRGNDVLCVAHNLERMADRVSNVCERTLFIATGELHEISETPGYTTMRY